MGENTTDRFTKMTGFWLSLSFIAGILAASLVSFPARNWAVAGVVIALIALVLRLMKRPSARAGTVFLVAVFCFGAGHYESQKPVTSPGEIASYNGNERKIYVTGTLIEAPDVRDTYQNLRIAVKSVDDGQGETPTAGLLLVRLDADEPLRYGTLVRVWGRVESPTETEEFSYRDYLARQGIHSVMRVNRVTVLPESETDALLAFVYRMKNSLLKVNYQLFTDPEAPLFAGILFGEDKQIAPNLVEAFKNTGTTHIIAISGFNIAIIAAVFVAIFSRLLGKRNGAILAVVGITIYTILAGADASVVRAAIMGTFSLLAQQLGRRNLALNTLAIVAAGMALFNPLVLWDIGFQLSFGATLGLVLYASPLQNAVEAFLARRFSVTVAQKVIGPLSEYFLMTLAAQLTTLPIIIYYFGRVSLVSLIANPFILPAQPALMVLGGLAVALGKIYLPLGQFVGFFAWPFASYTIRMVEFFNGWPNGVWVLGDFNLLFIIVFYGILFGLTLAAARFAWVSSAISPSVTLSALAVVTVLMWRTALNIPDGRLHITFFDVGSGSAIFLETPTGRYVLINGGPSPSRLADQLGRRIPPFNRGIDYLVVGSTQENELAALPRTLERFKSQNVLWAGNVAASYSAAQLNETITRQGILMRKARTGDAIDLGNGAKLTMLYVSPRGAVLKIEWNKFQALLPLGINADTFTALENGRAVGQVNLLLLADQGYLPANPPEWIRNLSPQALVLSVAADDTNGLPDPALIESLEGYNILRTDVNGWIKISTDGEQMWFEVERK
jgi:competence protein ComEC